MAANADDPCVVYYIFDATCSDPYCHGYIGITQDEKVREQAHRRSGRCHADAQFVVLFRGTRRECAAIEKQYRPQPGIGWNASRGGGRWRKP